MTKKTENTVADIVFPDLAAIEWIAHAPAIKVGGDVVIVSDDLVEEVSAAPAKKPRKSSKKTEVAGEDKPKAKPGRKPGRKAAAKKDDMDDIGDDEMIDLDMDADEEGGEDLSELEELDRVSDGVDASSDSEDHVPNGYSSLVRLGRQRGWVTVAEINDHLPDNVRGATKSR